MYKKSAANRRRSPLAINAGPTQDDLIADLNKCRLYILDAADRAAPQKPVFADRKRGFPLLVAGGKVAYDWEENRKTFTARVVSLQADTNHTDYSKPVPTRAVVVGVQLEFRGSNGFVAESAMWSIASNEDIIYDVNGKLLRG